MVAPETAFEQRGRVAPWTTLTEEQTFIQELEAFSPRITTEIVGQGAAGADMRMVTLAAPVRAQRTILFVAQQHGSELSGREAMFTRLRDWADSDDPEFLSFLETTTILCIPTAHPDDIDNRLNPNGVNINRDHVNITQPEARAIHGVIRDHTPSLIVDLHEGANITNEYATSPPLNTNADPQVMGLSDELNEVVRDAIVDAGHTWELYQGGNIVGPEYLQNSGALRNAVSILLETRRVYGNNTDATLRHDLQLIAVDAILDWHRVNRVVVEDVTDSAGARQSARHDPFRLMTGIVRPDSAPLLDPLPQSYTLTHEQHDGIAVHRDLFGISSEEKGGGYRVLLSQAAQPFIPYLLDQDSPVREVDGVRDAPHPPPILPQPTARLAEGSFSAMFYRAGGETAGVATMLFRSGETKQEVWHKS